MNKIIDNIVDIIIYLDSLNDKEFKEYVLNKLDYFNKGNK